MKVLVVVARRFNGHELWTTLGVLRSRGHNVEVVSTDTSLMDEVTGRRVTLMKTLDDVKNLLQYEALMFISGNMQDTESYWSDPRTLEYVNEAHKRHIPIAAICCSVPTIRNAAKGKRVSFFPLIRSERLLKEAGAILSRLTYSVDDNLVTAEHQMATQMWAEAFCDVMDNKPHAVELKDSGYIPLGHERKPIPGLEHIKDVIKRTGKNEI